MKAHFVKYLRFVLYFFLCYFVLSVVIFSVWQARDIRALESNVQHLQDSLFWTKECVLEQVSLAGDGMDSLCKYLQTNFGKVQKTVLVYRYSLTMCETCIEEDLKMLSQYKEELGFENILLLVSYPENRDNVIKGKRLSNGFHVLHIEERDFPFPKNRDGLSSRFFALYTTYGKMKYIYYPSLKCEDVTHQYFKAVLLEMKKK